MTPEEFKAAREKLGLSLRQTAHILGVGQPTVTKWEMPPEAKSRAKPNPTAVRVMQWMLEGFRPPEWPSRPAAGLSGPRPKGDQ